MAAPTLADAARALRASWDAATCDPADLPWSPANPSRGQCGVTALVLHELLGGEVLLGEVHVDGVRTGHHYWNVLPGGAEVDLTRAQFRPDEHVTAGEPVALPSPLPREMRCREQYELLRARVAAALAPERHGERRSTR